MAVVVFPTPPFWFVIAIILLIPEELVSTRLAVAAFQGRAWGADD